MLPTTSAGPVRLGEGGSGSRARPMAGPSWAHPHAMAALSVGYSRQLLSQRHRSDIRMATRDATAPVALGRPQSLWRYEAVGSYRRTPVDELEASRAA